MSSSKVRLGGQDPIHSDLAAPLEEMGPGSSHFRTQLKSRTALVKTVCGTRDAGAYPEGTNYQYGKGPST